MYKRLSRKITEKFINIGIISEEDYEIYKYGFELIIALLLTVTDIVLISVLIHKLFQTVLYLIGFFSVRAICGGYHAKHHYSCFIITNLSYFLFLLLDYCFSEKPYIIFVTGFMCIISSVFIGAFAPIEHPDNPMTEYRRKRNRFLSKVLLIVVCVICFAAFFFKRTSPYVFDCVTGVFLAAVAILTAKIEMIILKRREESL